MVEITLEFKDGESITVQLPEYIALEWRDDKKVNNDIKKQGASIKEFRLIGE